MLLDLAHVTLYWATAVSSSHKATKSTVSFSPLKFPKDLNTMQSLFWVALSDDQMAIITTMSTDCLLI